MNNKFYGFMAAFGFIIAAILMYRSLTTYDLVYSWIFALGSLIALLNSNIHLTDIKMNILKDMITDLQNEVVLLKAKKK